MSTFFEKLKALFTVEKPKPMFVEYKVNGEMRKFNYLTPEEFVAELNESVDKTIGGVDEQYAKLRDKLINDVDYFKSLDARFVNGPTFIGLDKEAYAVRSVAVYCSSYTDLSDVKVVLDSMEYIYNIRLNKKLVGYQERVEDGVEDGTTDEPLYQHVFIIRGIYKNYK